MRDFGATVQCEYPWTATGIRNSTTPAAATTGRPCTCGIRRPKSAAANSAATAAAKATQVSAPGGPWRRR